MKHFFVVILAWALLTGPALAETPRRIISLAPKCNGDPL